MHIGACRFADEGGIVPATSVHVTDLETAGLCDNDANDLLQTLAVLPPHHPSRESMREQTIEAWMPLAQHLASRFSGRGEPVDDLVQTATVGLIKAVDKFDPSRGVD